MISSAYPSIIIRLIYSYLINRTLRITVNNTKSSPTSIKAGVPQGSVLEPRLFNIYFDYINDIIKFSRTNLALFADDMAIYAHSFSAIVAAKQVQIHVDLLQRYYDKWKIALNTEETETIVFARKVKNIRIIQPIKVFNDVSQVKTTVQYLEVNFDYKLTYKIHVNTVLRKTYSVMK